MSKLKTYQTRKSSEYIFLIEFFFNGTLGTCNTAPVELELKGDAEPVCLQPYPVLRVHEAMFIK